MVTVCEASANIVPLRLKRVSLAKTLQAFKMETPDYFQVLVDFLEDL